MGKAIDLSCHLIVLHTKDKCYSRCLHLDQNSLRRSLATYFSRHSPSPLPLFPSSAASVSLSVRYFFSNTASPGVSHLQPLPLILQLALATIDLHDVVRLTTLHDNARATARATPSLHTHISHHQPRHESLLRYLGNPMYLGTYAVVVEERRVLRCHILRYGHNT